MSDPIENLKERMSGTRLKSQTTIASYSVIGRQFLATLRRGQIPGRADVDRYFAARRRKEIGEGTLHKEWFAIRKLFQANNWKWDMTEDDVPYVEDESIPKWMSYENVEKMILSQKKLTPEERFYLSVATTWIVRRQELAKIKKRDYDGNVFLIHTAKHGRPVKALIPDVLKPVFAEFRAQGHSVGVMSTMFNRICDRTGIPREDGTGWHALRYTVDSFLIDALKTKKMSLTLMGDYAGWKPAKLSQAAGGPVMMHRYHHPEIVTADPYDAFRQIYPVHPFLKLWEKALRSKPALAKVPPKVPAKN